MKKYLSTKYKYILSTYT